MNYIETAQIELMGLDITYTIQILLCPVLNGLIVGSLTEEKHCKLPSRTQNNISVSWDSDIAPLLLTISKQLEKRLEFNIPTYLEPAHRFCRVISKPKKQKVEQLLDLSQIEENSREILNAPLHYSRQEVGNSLPELFPDSIEEENAAFLPVIFKPRSRIYKKIKPTSIQPFPIEVKSTKPPLGISREAMTNVKHKSKSTPQGLNKHIYLRTTDSKAPELKQ